MIRVIKIGGNIIDSRELLKEFAKNFAAMPGKKILVHGGGVMASRMQKSMGMTPLMIDGRRVTDEEALKVVTMVYAGWCSKSMTALLQAEGCNAIGLSGADGNVIKAAKRAPIYSEALGRDVDYGYVGDVTPERVNAGFISSLLDSGIVPVFNAINHDGEGRLLNTNADTIASSIAVAMARSGNETELIYCFEKDGVLYDRNDDSSVIPEITRERFEELKAEGRVAEGMVPKLDNSFKAIDSGVSRVMIKHAGNLLNEVGTVLVEEARRSAARVSQGETSGEHGEVAEAVRLLKEMIAVPSPSFEEDKVCTLISNWLNDKNIHHKRVGNNIVAENITDPSRPTLMLCAHIDTVTPVNEYGFDPYKPDYEAAAVEISSACGIEYGPEEIVAGLGSNDDGASVVSMISVYRHFLSLADAPNLILALTCEEERSGIGGMTGLWPALASKVDFAIVGEPTGMKAATSERGLLVIDATAHGTGGHAARDEGENALYIAMEDIARLRSHRFGKVSETMGAVKMNVTQINAGTAHNIIPDTCAFVIDIRPTELYTNEEILHELQGICRSVLKPRSLANRSSACTPDSPLKRTALELGIKTYSSPTTSDWMRIGCDAIKMGPGESSRSHRGNEFVLTGEISDGIAKYIEFIRKFNGTV